MASSSRIEKERFKANKPHFVKIIIQENIDNGKLAIPIKFGRTHGKDLKNKVILEVPTGAKWEVELVKYGDGKFWLENGWKEFEEYYSLSYGHCIVFEYNGGNHFNVLICDKSATEIDYPFTTTNCNCDEEGNCGGEFQEKMKEKTRDDVPVEILEDVVYGSQKRKEEETRDDVSVEILEDISGSKKRKEKLPLSSPTPSPHKMLKTKFASCKTSLLSASAKSVKAEDNSMSKENPLSHTRHFEALGDDRDTSSRKQSLIKVTRRMEPLKVAEKDSAIRKASTIFKSKNPFFMTVMQPSYVHFVNNMNIPYNFAKTYFKKEHGQVILGTVDGRTWTANYSCRVFNRRPKASFACCGWRKFSLDNNLEVGDVCVFELIKGTEISLQVSIFRAKEKGISGHSPVHSTGANQLKPIESLVAETESDCISKDETKIPSHHGNVGKSVFRKSIGGQVTKGFAVADKFVSKYPFYKIVLKSYHFEQCNVHVPLSFIGKYIIEHKHKEQTMALQIADRLWPVKLITYSRPKSAAKICSGWTAFARENFLQVGDACVFEMISSDVLKVTIFRRK